MSDDEGNLTECGIGYAFDALLWDEDSFQSTGDEQTPENTLTMCIFCFSEMAINSM